MEGIMQSSTYDHDLRQVQITSQGGEGILKLIDNSYEISVHMRAAGSFRAVFVTTSRADKSQ